MSATIIVGLVSLVIFVILGVVKPGKSLFD